MGTSTNAILVYGYDLGSSEDGWKVEPNEELEAEGYYDTETAADALRASVGFTEQDWRADGYFERKNAADAKVGVALKRYCHSDFPMYVLAAETITVYRGDCKTLDFTALAGQVQAKGWDAKLARALEALGLTPLQKKPEWLLVSYWG
jgi:hypothetical protein